MLYKEDEFGYSLSCKIPFLFYKNITQRVRWGRTNKDWTQTQLSPAFFTDESGFIVGLMKSELHLCFNFGSVTSFVDHKIPSTCVVIYENSCLVDVSTGRRRNKTPRRYWQYNGSDVAVNEAVRIYFEPATALDPRPPASVAI